MIEFFAMGIDLGTSGVKLSIINNKSKSIYNSSLEYQNGLERCEDWKMCCINLIQAIPTEIKSQLVSCAVAGTSGTIMAANYQGKPLGKAIPYNFSYPEEHESIPESFLEIKNELTINNSFSRASRLIRKFGDEIILRHQADWVSSWLTDNWVYGEEGNNIKLGWDITTKSWPKIYQKLSWLKCLPEIISSGKVFGTISNVLAKRLSLRTDLLIIAGTTDSNAAVIATKAKENEGVTILGSTIVVKKYISYPIHNPGVTNHKLLKKWLCGGSSNAGCKVLNQFYNNEELIELSKQIKPELDSGLHLLPLACKGERFPTFDPELEPILEPRPVSDCLYLHALFEGLAEIESKSWKKLETLGVSLPEKIITIGGGAHNSTWRRIRERIIGIPIRTSLKPPAMGVAEIALNAISTQSKTN